MSGDYGSYQNGTKRIMISMKAEERKIYDSALSDYSDIVRGGGNSIDEIKECMSVMERFEDYEKCQDLLRILKAYSGIKKDNDGRKSS
jgi:hypothetical protein